MTIWIEDKGGRGDSQARGDKGLRILTTQPATVRPILGWLTLAAGEDGESKLRAIVLPSSVMSDACLWQ